MAQWLACWLAPFRARDAGAPPTLSPPLAIPDSLSCFPDYRENSWFFQDTMDAMGDRTRERLTEMRNGMLRLHKSLLDSERALYERDVARITSTGQYLGLVMD